MYIARVLYPIKVLGPGERIGIWVSGCGHGCRGCSNPELWEQTQHQKISVKELVSLIKLIASKHPVDGFTITGGEPMDQSTELMELIRELSEFSKDILVYTGYSYNQIKNSHKSILRQIAVLIDGKYVEELNNGCPLRGSENQRIIYICDDFRGRYENYLAGYNRQLQNFEVSNGIISVGLQRPGFREELKEKLAKKGLGKSG